MNNKENIQGAKRSEMQLINWIIVIIFLIISGLSYVYLKNKNHDYGQSQRRMEHELAEIIFRNNVMQAKIAQLTSYATLRKKVDDGTLELAPIEAKSLIKIAIREKNSTGLNNQVRQVSHENSFKN